MAVLIHEHSLQCHIESTVTAQHENSKVTLILFQELLHDQVCTSVPGGKISPERLFYLSYSLNEIVPFDLAFSYSRSGIHYKIKHVQLTSKTFSAYLTEPMASFE